jgi:predicted small secreted protein
LEGFKERRDIMKKFITVIVSVMVVSMVIYSAAPCFGQMRGRGTGMMGRYAPFNYNLVSKYIPEEISIKTIANTWYSVSGIYVRLMPG